MKPVKGKPVSGRKRNRCAGRRVWRLLAGAVVFMVLLTLLLTLPLRWLPPPTTAFMLHAHYTGLGGGQSCARVEYQWIDLEAVAPAMQLAAIAAEDQRFPYHRGLDIDAIASALKERRDQGRVRGASTLTQQLAKNLYLWPDQSWVRKGFEVWLTVALELTLPKQRILEVYLNVVQFGECVFGVQAASRHFFHSDAEVLSGWQAARMAAVLPAPVRYRIDHPGDYVRQRSNWIREQMRLLGGVAYLRSL